jgi:hypothetical protein
MCRKRLGDIRPPTPRLSFVSWTVTVPGHFETIQVYPEPRLSAYVTLPTA